MIENFYKPSFFRASCCPRLTSSEAETFWPRLKKGTVIPEDTIDLALKWFQTRFKLQGFNYKVSKQTNRLTLLQVVFTDGIKGPIIKAKNETEENIQTVLLQDGQYVTSLIKIRISHVDIKHSFLDQNDKVVLSYLEENAAWIDFTQTREVGGQRL